MIPCCIYVQQNLYLFWRGGEKITVNILHLSFANRVPQTLKCRPALFDAIFSYNLAFSKICSQDSLRFIFQLCIAFINVYHSDPYINILQIRSSLEIYLMQIYFPYSGHILDCRLYQFLFNSYFNISQLSTKNLRYLKSFT